MNKLKKLNKQSLFQALQMKYQVNLDKQMQVVKENNMSYQCLRDVDGINIGNILEMFKEKVYDRLVKENIKIS